MEETWSTDQQVLTPGRATGYFALNDTSVVLRPSCVLGAKLRTVMSSIIRWRKGETLRADGMG